MTVRPLEARSTQPVKQSVLSIDIERSPMLVRTWGLFNQNIGIGQIVEHSAMISWAAVSLGDEANPTFRSVYHNTKTKMLNDLWDVLDGADVLITYNGLGFDKKHMMTELLKAGLTRPSKWRDIDLLPFTRRHFKFDSNKLDFVSQALKIGKKLDYGTSHIDLLAGCERGDEDAMQMLRAYNIQDSLLNLELYSTYRGLGWL